MALLVGIPTLAVAADAVTGLVAGVGAGGIVVLRKDGPENWKYRAVAIAFASVYTAVIVRTAGAIALISAPVFPFTAIGLADYWAFRQAARDQDPSGDRSGAPREPSST